MPANLNALIRFKQIDLCLRDPKINSTIPVLRRRCIAQLDLYRGVRDISERTIHGDIRMMRGDAMGFNAPIVVKNGIYSYADEDYSIFNITISEMDLLIKVTRLLIEEKEKIKNEKLNGILKELSSITGVKIEEEETEEELIAKDTHHFNITSNLMNFNNSDLTISKKDKIDSDQLKRLFEEKCKNGIKMEENSKQQKPTIYSWESIFEVL